LTDLSTDLLPGARESLAVLERGHSPNKELYLFSDMQRLGWEQQSAPQVETMRQLDEKATVYLVRCGTRTPRNVAVVGLAPQWACRGWESAPPSRYSCARRAGASARFDRVVVRQRSR
jgi:hypothetical protein